MLELQEHLRALGYIVDNVICDGVIHRFGPGRKNQWYVAYRNFTRKEGKEFGVITFGDWSTGEPARTYSTNAVNLDDDDRSAIRKQIREAKKKNEEERKSQQEEVAKEVQAKWNSLAETGGSPYLERKKISAYGIRFDGTDLYVPVKDEAGVIWSLQKIQADGSKYFHPGGRVQGCFHTIEGHSECTYLCEGYATAASIHLSTGSTVVCAFNAGNLCSVAEKIKGKIVIAGDDDVFTDKNAGRVAAENSAKAIHASVVFPKFRDVNGEGTLTDFNDLHCTEGITEVRSQLEKSSVGVATPEIDENIDDKSSKLSEEEIESWGKEILDCRFKLIRNEEALVLLHIKDINKKEVKVCLNEEYLLSRLRTNIIEKKGMTPTLPFLDKIYKTWELSTEAIKTPSTFSWMDSDEWTFKKLDFIPCAGPIDAWKEFLDRLSAQNDFMSFIWSIFEPLSKSRQYLYLFDPNGEGGKSTVISILGEVFGNAYAAINNTSVNGSSNKWLMGNLYGKRLVAWPDCKNTHFCMSELLRNMTSGDDVTVEFKGKQPFTSKMYVKLIIASNHEPSVTSGKADLSRLIRVDVKKNTRTNQPGWRDRLTAQLPHFLFECRKQYELKCAEHGDIVLDEDTKELASDSTSELEIRWETIASNHMVFGEEMQSSISDWIDLCDRQKLLPRDVSHFKDYLLQSNSVHIKRPGYTGKRPRMMIGVKIYPNPSISEIEIIKASSKPKALDVHK